MTQKITGKEDLKKARREKALALLKALDQKGISRYELHLKTGITHNTTRYWLKEIWAPSARVLTRLENFTQEVVNGKTETQQAK